MIAPLCSVAVLGALRSWAFSSDPTVQRHAVIACITVVLVCLAGLLILRRGSVRFGLAEAHTAVRPEGDTGSSGLPPSVPSARLQRWRGLFGMIGFFAALVGAWGLVVGGDVQAGGRTMSTGCAWGLTIAIGVIAVLLLGYTALTGGFRSVTALDRDIRALRGSCAGAGRWIGHEEGGTSDVECLLVQAEDGDTLHFWVERQTSATAEAAGDEAVWACWRTTGTEPKTGRRTAAILIGDSGWALHGGVWVAEAQALEQHGAQVVGNEGAPVGDRRSVRLWSPVSAWPLVLPLRSLVCVVVALAAAGACLTDLVGQWRWTLGAINNLALLSAVAMYLGAGSWSAKGAVRKSSPTVSTGAKAG